MPLQFNRTGYTELWLTLSSNEQLGILDSLYLEDYNGVDGQVSLLHVGTNTRYAVLMGGVPAATPAVPNDVFEGFMTLTGKPDGLYAVQGRCRDVLGNYTILGAVATPLGGERLMALEIDVLSESAVRFTRTLGPLTIRPGFTLRATTTKAVTLAVGIAATALTMLTPKALTVQAATTKAVTLKATV